MTNSILDDLPLPPTPTELDIINSTPPLDLTAFDIDKIIADQRQRRALKASGEYKRIAKAKESVDLSAILERGGIGTGPKPPPQITRPAHGGFNRFRK